MGIDHPAGRFLESCLFIDQKFIVASLLTESPLPVERMFGDAAWGRYLQGRLVTRLEGDSGSHQGAGAELIDLVHTYLCGEPGQKQDTLRGYRGGMGGQFVSGAFLPIDFTEAQLRGLASQEYPTFLSVHDPAAPRRGFIKYPDMYKHEMRAILFRALQEAESQPDPYVAAAYFQQQYVGIHPAAGWERAANGRISRVLMQWLLEWCGCPPSIVPDFDMDILSTHEEWTETVRTGSQRYVAMHRMIAAGESDPAVLLGLEAAVDFHAEYTPPADHIIPVYYPDALHPHWITDTYLQGLRSAMRMAGLAITF